MFPKKPVYRDSNTPSRISGINHTTTGPWWILMKGTKFISTPIKFNKNSFIQNHIFNRHFYMMINKSSSWKDSFTLHSLKTKKASNLSQLTGCWKFNSIDRINCLWKWVYIRLCGIVNKIYHRDIEWEIRDLFYKPPKTETLETIEGSIQSIRKEKKIYNVRASSWNEFCSPWKKKSYQAKIRCFWHSL